MTFVCFTALSWDYADEALYYIISSSPPQIWDMDPNDPQHVTMVHQAKTGENPHNMVVVPHLHEGFWISGGSDLEYAELGSRFDVEIKTVNLQYPLKNPSKLVHDVKYDLLFAVVEGLTDGGHTDLYSIYYNGTMSDYMFSDRHIEDIVIYNEYAVLVHRQGNAYILKTSDLGLTLPLYNSVEQGQITGVENITAIKILDLEALQPPEPRQCDQTSYGGCDHICVPDYTSGTPTCECYVGYQKAQDGTCKTQPVSDNFILVTDYTYNQIFQVSLGATTQAVAVPVPDLGRPDGVLWDHTRGLVLWSTDRSRSVYSANLDGSDQRVFAELTELIAKPDRIAIEPTTGNVYFTAVSDFSSELQDSMIGVFNGNGSNAVVVWEGHQPRDIVLDSSEGVMFWTDFGSSAPGIYKANMDGGNHKEIIHNDIVWPNGLAIDHQAQRIYWTDGFLDRIYSTNYEGEDRTLVRQLPRQSHLMDIELVDDYLYFTDIYKRQVQRMRKSGEGALESVGPMEMGNLQSMYIFRSTATLPKSSACAEDNGGCSDFCFPAPGGQRTCGCNWYTSLLADGKTCENVPRCPVKIPNGVIVEDSSCVRAPGHACAFNCSASYTARADVGLITCTENVDEDGKLMWDVQDPCEEIQCPYFIDNGQVNSTCSMRPGALCTFDCNAGFQPAMGARHVMCLREGTWNATSRNQPLCIEIVRSEQLIADGSKKAAIGVGVGVGIAVLIVIIIVVLFLLYRLGKLSVPFRKKDASNGSSFENPRYRENNVDLQPVGTPEAGNGFGYSNLAEDKADLTQESWRRTQQAAPGNTYDNNVPKR
ncbi:low-density lipoprotein receptor-related protein 2-like [Mya arenaria]|uniref:low-density lipoprotein receptor-related protein 2-like n=1 Tax=Mya arenaria TaxID=6604 RepID=UPI0022E3ED7F|nr:low-density lipoprotein receptor-related protein 2-like [Mya arenaria]